MKYFIDTEFLEGAQNKTFLGMNVGKTKPTVDLISIGIVAEDGREYYAISKEFNLKEAWNRYDEIKDGFRDCGMTPNYKRVYWIRENVLKPIFIELRAKEVEEYNIAKRINVVLDFPTYSFCFREFKRLIKKYGKTNKQIAQEIKEFVGTEETIGNWEQVKDKMNTQFYGYYADYDWVVFCWLFGKMIDLPKGFPMYCIDLKQVSDETLIRLINEENKKAPLHYTGVPKWKKFINDYDIIKKLPNYPKQSNEHNALADARWNKQLYNFLNTL